MYLLNTFNNLFIMKIQTQNPLQNPNPTSSPKKSTKFIDQKFYETGVLKIYTESELTTESKSGKFFVNTKKYMW